MHLVQPTPTLSPQQYQQAQQIIEQIKTHQLTGNQAYYASLAFLNPLPLGWKFAIYHFLSSLPIPPLPTVFLIILVVFGPFLFLLLLIAFVYLTYRFITWCIPVLVAHLSPELKEKTYLEVTFPSDTAKSAYATEQLYKLMHTLARRKTGYFQPDKTYSLEIVATGEEGIRYIIGLSKSDAEVMHRSLLSYIPGIQVKEIADYLKTSNFLESVSQLAENADEESDEDNKTVSSDRKTMGVVEFTLSDDFVLPLQNQKSLGVHDPVSFLTANMTKLAPGELISYQIITNPTITAKVRTHMQVRRNTIALGKPLTPLLAKKQLLPGLPSFIWFILSPTLWLLFAGVKLAVHIPYLVLDPNGPQSKSFFGGTTTQVQLQQQTLFNPYEQELSVVVKEKCNQQLFQSSIRLLIVTNDEYAFETRELGLVASFGQFRSAYQSLVTKGITSIPWFSSRAMNKRFTDFTTRKLTSDTTILSSSELADLYHFPNMDLTKIEGMVKSKSNILPTPLSFKKAGTTLDVVVGMNTHGGGNIPVGLTTKDRRQHTYILGKTGMGKSTIIEGMALQDIVSGKGVCVIDPHGDMIEHLLTVIPSARQKDVIYVNPADKDNPLGLNILNPGIHFADLQEEHDWIAGAVMEVFMKITPEKNWGQRMEHILRNAILTVLQTTPDNSDSPYVSLFAIQKLLTDEIYRKKVTASIKDPVLSQFWKKEFNLYRKNQQAEMVSPLTNKLGEFITNHMSRNILLQEKSTIHLSDIMDNGKILLVNLSKGKLREERSTFFGIIMTSLIQLAIHERAQFPEKERRDFFVYIDEFQNFATSQFTQLFSEARKYHVFFIPTHQNIAQIDDTKVAKIMQGNAGTLIALRGSPDDEKVMLPYLEPEVEKGHIVNLAPHHFFMKVTTDDNEDAFSGVTIPIKEEGNNKVKAEIIAYSREHYATPRLEVEEQLERLFKTTPYSAKKVTRTTKTGQQIQAAKKKKHTV